LNAKPLNVAIVWHQHQPDYKNGDLYEAPWVRLHSIKDYVDMVSIITQYPNVRLNVNLVPSLMRQIDDYVFNNAQDRFTVLMQKSSDFTKEEKIFILQRSFDISWENVIKKYPYYYSLLQKRGTSGEVDENTLKKFREYEYRDLLVWFNLAWFDPDFHKELNYFFMKEKHFTLEDCNFLIDFQKDIMSQIIPLHRNLMLQGRIELTTTPYYHPILPLIYNTSTASRAFKGIKLPKEFSYPGDAYIQVKKGLEFFRERFGKYPAGMWPAEGSVSKEIIPVFAQNNIKYIMTDEEVLAKSLGTVFERDEKGNVLNPEILYRPYVARQNNNSIFLVFRDRTLSDRIGFDYSKMSAEEAVEDMENYLLNIKQNVDTDKDYIVSIILDGENAWENYREDGKEFFHRMYSMFNQSRDLKLVTLEDYLEKNNNYGNIKELWSGSWIGADFTTWIGEDEENIAWEYLLEAREMFRKKMPVLNQQEKIDAFENILKAEGSDWFWWFGKDQESSNDIFFDEMFRKTLKKVYEICKEESPLYLDNPIIVYDDSNEKKGSIYFKPVIDGKKDKSWKNAYSIFSEANSGVMKKAPQGISSLYVTTWEDELYFYAEFENNIDMNSLFIYKDGEYISVSKVNSSLKDRSIEGRISEKVNRFALAVIEKDNIISRLPSKKDITPSYQIRHLLNKITAFEDKKHDDNGDGNIVYPGNTVFKKKMFDLNKTELYQDDNSYYFFVTLGNTDNPWNSPAGISTQTIDIYIGNTSQDKTPLLPGRKAFSRGVWDYAVSVEGWKQVLYVRDKDKITEISGIECSKDNITGELIIRVDKKNFKYPLSKETGFIITVCGQDGMDSNRIRKVLIDKTEWSFGGGRVDSSNIIDILDNGNQKKALSENIIEFVR
jgi:alpha-amylase/alpha-mannosidase (GH57 family)